MDRGSAEHEEVSVDASTIVDKLYLGGVEIDGSEFRDWSNRR